MFHEVFFRREKVVLFSFVLLKVEEKYLGLEDTQIPEELGTEGKKNWKKL